MLGYCSGIAWVLVGYCSGIARVLLGYCLGMLGYARVLLWHCFGIAWDCSGMLGYLGMLGYCLGIAWVLPGYYSGITRVFLGYTPVSFFFVQLHYKLTRYQSLQVLVAKMCRDGRGQRCAEMAEDRCGRDGMGT